MITSVFDAKRAYTFIRGAAIYDNLTETKKALNYARKMHNGQLRKTGDPYIVHPLIMTCNAIALGLRDDNLMALLLLHDVCEDCGVGPEELPVSEKVRSDVALLTFSVISGETKEQALDRYYSSIKSSREAVIAKLLDRVHNTSTMAQVFTKAKLKAYISETRQYVYPLIRWAKENYPEYSDALFLLKYQMTSVLNSIEGTMTIYENNDS